jgi:hypothetical protein
MAILPVLREVPVQEVVEIRNTGSYTIPEAARKAHRLLIDVEIVSVTRTQYLNLQYNLPQGDYCNVTYWCGASIIRTEKVKYASTRLIDWVNIEGSIAQQLGILGRVIVVTIGSLGLALGAPPIEGDRRAYSTWGFNVSHLKFVCPPGTQIRVTCQWYPFRDLDNIEEPDADLDDPANGEDEYPSPRRNPSDDPWDGNAVSSGPDPLRDPRDSDEANEPPPPGGDSVPGKLYKVKIQYGGAFGNDLEDDGPFYGPIRGTRIDSNPSGVRALLLASSDAAGTPYEFQRRTISTPGVEATMTLASVTEFTP